MTKPLYLDDDTVRRLLPVPEVLAAMRDALMQLSAGEVVQPLRMVMEVPAESGFFLLKPALTGRALATKLISFIPGNSARGLPTLLATVVLMDPNTGQTLAVMDGTWLTALRTAAVTAVAADAVVDNAPKVVALLGSGVLARTHALTLRAIRPVREIRVWSRDPDNVRRCAQDIAGVGCASAEAAVRDADIVITVTNATEPVLKGAWIKAGAFVGAIGAPRPNWRELDDEAMRNWVLVDSRESAEKEAGDIIGSGASIQAEIGEMLLGIAPRPPSGCTVVFKALGQAVEDALAARLVYERAIAQPETDG
jgi:thiomorpholine-carboxylate dehydrogenase